MQFSHIPAERGQWVASACASADPTTVVAQVPVGYERYVRILHPALDEDDQLVSWATAPQSRNHIITVMDLFETVAGLTRKETPPLKTHGWIRTCLWINFPKVSGSHWLRP